ncbi:putative leucine-rich repeat domain, L domain-containing protein [Medicago truncatula]|uniref:Putative leucine-rich repeat domain, L domain-containing protein n=1 Tax=Medicago truncatula TaxID=3880 RepID=A0A396H2V9_MEDTR|nr:putative leucine-rich repeat domain, L domain-containing protein [Medicago truncatula]
MFGKEKHLRTFLTINFTSNPFNHENAWCIILLNLKYLRVLSFRNYPYLYALPDLIDELIHLRYLDLSGTYIKLLPDSLCNMYNLQTLKMICCEQLAKLPNDMHKLVNLLRHLDISGILKLQEMPREMRKLKRLQHLSCFVVGQHEAKGIKKELGTLSDLHGSLSIKKLENVNSSFEASEARIIDKKYLEELELEWSEDAADDVENSQNEMDILCKLQRHKISRMG